MRMARTSRNGPGLGRPDDDAEALQQLPHGSIATTARIRCSRFGKLPHRLETFGAPASRRLRHHWDENDPLPGAFNVRVEGAPLMGLRSPLRQRARQPGS